MSKRHSPCVDVCKYGENGHCIGCSMTKPQKKIVKLLKTKNQRKVFIKLIILQQNFLGGFEHWQLAYSKRYKKTD